MPVWKFRLSMNCKLTLLETFRKITPSPPKKTLALEPGLATPMIVICSSQPADHWADVDVLGHEYWKRNVLKRLFEKIEFSSATVESTLSLNGPVFVIASVALRRSFVWLKSE